MSLIEVNEVWIPQWALAFWTTSPSRSCLSRSAPTSGLVRPSPAASHVLVTVKIDARSEEKAKAAAGVKIADVLRDRPFIIDSAP
jgi:hypothetical protein